MIANGTRLGPYEVLAPIGAGGMGEVYRARDARLDRVVAIKVLPARFSHDPRLRERFEREARAISSISHPHICALYDVGSQDGVEYLVMELLEGESLADRLGRGALPLEQALRYGVEIAEALDRAHRSGIVHRDLKPGNVILTKSGAKLLDFGLAKFSQPAFASDPNAATAAMSSLKPLTEEGTIVGTFHYMAPEQIEGREADARTDIFALGVVLYEMVTGRRAFDGKTKASLIASILDRDPSPISATQPLTPPALERVIKMCLVKDADERWQSAHDVAAELRWIGASSSETIGPAARKRARLGWLRNVGLTAAGIALGAFAVWQLAPRPPAPRGISRFSIRASPPLMLENSALAISNDGRSIVYRGLTNGAQEESKLYLRTLDNPTPVPIAGTEGAYSVTFSPDGRWVGFVRNRALWKIPREGGAATRLSDSPGGGLGISWFGDTLYATRGFAGGVWAIPANGGGEGKQLVKTDPAKQLRAVAWPEVLPDGKTYLATVWNVGGWDDSSIVAFPTAGGGPKKVVLPNAYFARYAPTGHLLFIRSGNLMAVPFDPDKLEAGTNAVVVMPNISHGGADGEAQFALSKTGSLVYANGGDSAPLSSLFWIDASGRQTPIVPTKRHYGGIDVAPDGRSAVVAIETSTYDVWNLDFERDSMTRLSYGGDDAGGVITPDGSRVIFTSSRTGAYNFYTRAIDGTGAEERLTTSTHDQEHACVSPDGKTMVFGQFGRRSDLWTMPLYTRQPRELIATEFDETEPAISPDGRWLAYTSNESGDYQVYITSFPTPAGKWQVSTDGGNSARWMPDGRSIVYHNGPKLLIAPLETTPRPRAGKPRLIVEGKYDEDYDVAPDNRIAIALSEGRKTTEEFQLVVNWFEELRRRVP
ncbi:MAG: serine/threonine-protein kinase [Acidobacteria bacterium]|nr:serine/threonine-protein kinase [Acidobacteriota bacterium]